MIRLVVGILCFAGLMAAGTRNALCVPPRRIVKNLPDIRVGPFVRISKKVILQGTKVIQLTTRYRLQGFKGRDSPISSGLWKAILETEDIRDKTTNVRTITRTSLVTEGEGRVRRRRTTTTGNRRYQLVDKADVSAGDGSDGPTGRVRTKFFADGSWRKEVWEAGIIRLKTEFSLRRNGSSKVTFKRYRADGTILDSETNVTDRSLSSSQGITQKRSHLRRFDGEGKITGEQGEISESSSRWSRREYWGAPENGPQHRELTNVELLSLTKTGSIRSPSGRPDRGVWGYRTRKKTTSAGDTESRVVESRGTLGTVGEPMMR